MPTVAEARSALDDLIRYGSDNFSAAQRDYAIQWALEETAKATGLLRTIGSISVSLNDRIITHGLTRFLPGRRYAPMYISTADAYTRVEARHLGDIQKALDASTTTGTPDMLYFISTTQCMIYPIADGSYTIEVPYEQTAPTWTYGDAGATSLEMPDAIVYGGMLWGAKMYLMSGVDNARAEEDKAEARWLAFLKRVTDTDTDLAIATHPRSTMPGEAQKPTPGA